MLLKTTPELKKYFSSIDKDYYFNSLESFIRDAITDIVIPEISQEQYDRVLDAYQANTLEGKLLQLHEALQKAITHLALFGNSDSGSFRISDAGYYVNVTEQTKPVSDKKMFQFRKSRAEAGYKALDQALLLMEQNITDPAFEAYKNSAVRDAAGGYFVSGPVEFTRAFSPLKNSGTTFRAVLSSIDQAEKDYILPVLGEDLFDQLKSSISDGSTSEIEKKLIGKIQKPLALYSIAEAIPLTGFEFDGKTFSVNALATNNDNVETSTSISDQRLSGLMNTCMINGKKELSRLQKFLQDNAASFPLYVKPEIDDQENDLNNVNRGFMFF